MFNHLKVPESWNSYFSKYPNGLTIMEALIDWVGQVDLMSDHINVYTFKIDDFLLKFDENLRNEVYTLISDWASSGYLQQLLVDIYGSEISRLDIQLSTKRDKSVLLTQSDLSTASESHKLTPNHLNQEIKDMMTGSTPVSPNIQDGQVTTQKLANLAVTNDKVANKTIQPDKLSNFTTNLGAELFVAGSEIYSSYVTNAGVVVTNGPVDVSRTEYIQIEPNESYILFSYTTSTLDLTGCFYDSDKKFVKNLAGSELLGNLLLTKAPANAKYIIINNNRQNASNMTLKKVKKVWFPWLETPTQEEKHTSLTHCLDKPFVFSGKSSVWFGDSITVGVTSPSLVVSSNGYAKQTAQKLGLSFENKAVSGSTIADSTKTAVQSQYNIVNVIESYSTIKDYVFVSGGTNDWTLGVPLGVLGDSTKTTFYGALQVICDSIKTNNPSAKVIFITPINQNVGRPNSVDTLDKYRQAIFEVAVKNEHSVVDGSSIGFPKEQNSFSQVVCSDGVHPEQVGHDFYAKSLAGILL